MLKRKQRLKKQKQQKTEKVKREAENKLSDNAAASPEQTGVSKKKRLAKNEQLYETLRNKNDVSGCVHLLKSLHRQM